MRNVVVEPGESLHFHTSIAATTQLRLAHSDFDPADQLNYRKNKVQGKKSNSVDTTSGFHYLATGGNVFAGFHDCMFATNQPLAFLFPATFALALYGSKGLVHSTVGFLSAAKDVLAMAKIEINTDEIPEGKSVTFNWNGKPLFVRHRTPEEIKTEQGVNVTELRDPQADAVNIFEEISKKLQVVICAFCRSA